MRIVSLTPFLTEIAALLGVEESVVGISHLCDHPRSLLDRPRVTVPSAGGNTVKIEQLDGESFVDIDALRALSPDVVIAGCPETEKNGGLAELRERLGLESTRILTFLPITLQDVYAAYDWLGEVLGKGAKGRELAARHQAQFSDWGRNFYDRTRGRKATFVSGVSPYKLGGYWIPDLIATMSATSQCPSGEMRHPETSWKAIQEYNPDVILFAPKGYTVEQSARILFELEKMPDNEKIGAFKRGQVYFCDGLSYFYRPGPRLIDSMGILVSAIGGMDSGYISPRDAFYRMRWIEMNRHKFKG